jgi:hypothetical protein
MLLTVYSDEALSGSNVFEWFKLFKDGRADLQDDPRSGRPSTSRNANTIANIREMVTGDRRLTLRMMLDVININKETVRQILHEDLRKRKICAKFVPRSLTDEQKQRSETSKHAMDLKVITKAQKVSFANVQDQNHADHIF